MLHDIIGKIWDKLEIPTGWKEEYLVKLPKKGDLQECKNYRGLMFLSMPGKISSTVIYLGQTENSGGHQTQRPPGRLP